MRQRWKNGMRLLFLNHSKGQGIYGIEQWMLRMGRELIRQGHGAMLACRGGSGIFEAAPEFGIEPEALPILSGLEIAAAMRLRGMLVRGRIDAVIGKTYKGVRVAALARLGLRIPVFCRRGNPLDVQNTLRHRLTLGLTGAHVIAPSQAVKDSFCRAPWLNPDRVHVLRHGVDPKEFEAVAPQPMPDCEARILFSGRLAPVKGVDVLLNAWSKVIRNRPKARLILLGAKEAHDYEALAATLGIQDTIAWAGYKKDVRPWLAAADVLVMPSRSEGAGLAALEAMAMGRAVVASRVGGIPEYVEDNCCGLLVEPENPDALASALLRLISDPAERARMGQAGRRRAFSEFSLEASARTLISWIEPSRA